MIDIFKTKIKIYNDRVYINFQYNKLRRDDKHCTCLSVIQSILVNS